MPKRRQACALRKTQRRPECVVASIEPTPVEESHSAVLRAIFHVPLPRYQDAVRIFRRELVAFVIMLHEGNRTRAATALGLQRTYFVRLIRDLGLVESSPSRYQVVPRAGPVDVVPVEEPRPRLNGRQVVIPGRVAEAAQLLKLRGLYM